MAAAVRHMAVTAYQTDADDITWYTVRIQTAVRQWTVKRRYSQFLKLHRTLRTRFEDFNPPNPFPPKQFHILPSIFRLTKEDSEHESRREGLEKYLTGIIDAGNLADDWISSLEWLDFIEMPGRKPTSIFSIPRTHSPSVMSGDSGSSPGTPKPPTSRNSRRYGSDESSINSSSISAALSPSTPKLGNSFVQWNSTQRDVELKLANLRSMLRRRDSTSSYRALNDASQNSKDLRGQLTDAISSVENLERILANDVRSGLGEGEIRRRKDFLRNIWSDIRKLEQQVDKALNVKSVGGNSTPKPLTPSQRSERTLLFTPSTAPMVSASIVASQSPARPVSKRVFGNSALEMEETRNVSNPGLIALQNEMMEQQDRQLETLSTAIQRQKELGMIIGEELDQQNKLLGEMEGDVERVNTKVKASNRLMNKIR